MVTGIEGPEQFLWRGRLWKVRAVLAHWVETGPWWQSAGVRAVVGSDDLPNGSESDEPAPRGAVAVDLLAERELWRVEAGQGRAPEMTRGAVREGEGGSGGVFDLAFDWNDGRWSLVGCVD